VIRTAGFDDIPALTDMGEKFFYGSYHAQNTTFDYESFGYYLTGLIQSDDSDVFTITDGVGFSSSSVFASPFNMAELIGMEHMIYVAVPGKGVMLLKHMEKWAKTKGAICFESSFDGRDISNIYTRLGYSSNGSNYIKRL